MRKQLKRCSPWNASFGLPDLLDIVPALLDGLLDADVAAEMRAELQDVPEVSEKDDRRDGLLGMPLQPLPLVLPDVLVEKPARVGNLSKEKPNMRLTFCNRKLKSWQPCKDLMMRSCHIEIHAMTSLN